MEPMSREVYFVKSVHFIIVVESAQFTYPVTFFHYHSILPIFMLHSFLILDMRVCTPIKVVNSTVTVQSSVL